MGKNCSKFFSSPGFGQKPYTYLQCVLSSRRSIGVEVGEAWVPVNVSLTSGDLGQVKLMSLSLCGLQQKSGLIIPTS